MVNSNILIILTFVSFVIGYVLGKENDIKAWIKRRHAIKIANIHLRMIQEFVSPLKCELTWTNIDGETCPWITITGESVETRTNLRERLYSLMAESIPIDVPYPLISIDITEKTEETMNTNEQIESFAIASTASWLERTTPLHGLPTEDSIDRYYEEAEACAKMAIAASERLRASSKPISQTPTIEELAYKVCNYFVEVSKAQHIEDITVILRHYATTLKESEKQTHD